ncbi:hypothetical protein MNBD_GAMMA25-976 [hydrothermal vent metagenome]|uniref:Uncharacterized protein n=1 Tax=hydrothermal vent metagenome TaxID=652676 RepID=A0A3B1B6F3_9ZZZZ
MQPGVAISPAGRVLELSLPLSIDLGDRSLIAQLNNGDHRHLNRGLYAVVLRYAEDKTDIAEVFPQDLGASRTAQYDLITESVQLGLVALSQPLPQQSWLAIRANLIREYLGDGQASGIIPENSVALGVLAIREDQPKWLDADLLRHPLRAALNQGDIQQDLARHYETLFKDVMDYRRSGSLGSDFAASEYFHLLPPVGSLPKEAINPKKGRQGYFPENYRVWTAPIRMSDLELVRKESMRLPPIDLSLNEPVDVIVLAPLSNRDYGYYSRRLEREFDPNVGRLPHLDLLRLRLYPRRPIHELDTDEATWRSIWGRVQDQSLLYIRRPTRAAETAISGIVLARGMTLPEPIEPAEPTPADSGGMIQDEDTVFLNRINFQQISLQRPPQNATGEEALSYLIAEFGDNAVVVKACLKILLRIEHRYDALIWQTLLVLARAEILDVFLDDLTTEQASDAVTSSAVVTVGTSHGLDATLLNAWQALDAS